MGSLYLVPFFPGLGFRVPLGCPHVFKARPAFFGKCLGFSGLALFET